LVLGLGKRDHHGQLAVRRQAVALVRPGVLFLVEQRALREERAQGGYDR
jgi:hypothetical protein